MLGTNQMKMFALAIVAVLGFAIPALANGRHGGPEGGGPGLGLRSRGVLNQLIFPCQSDCAATAQTCNDTADSDAVTCISGACASDVSAAQTACQADSHAQACGTAVRALAECAASCLETRATALGVCRDALSECRDACESAQ